jgi:hypothetical protein
VIKHKTYTVKDVTNAIRKNGLPKIKGQWLSYEENSPWRPIGGCALGQASLNLNVPANHLQIKLSTIVPELVNDIVELNDRTDKTLPQIADEIEERYRKQLFVTIDFVE